MTPAITNATQRPTSKGTKPHENSCGINITKTAGHGATPPSPMTTLGVRNTAKMIARATTLSHSPVIRFVRANAATMIGIQSIAPTITIDPAGAVRIAETMNETTNSAMAATAITEMLGEIVRALRLGVKLSNMAKSDGKASPRVIGSIRAAGRRIDSWTLREVERRPDVIGNQFSTTACN